jgi:hypothetical protein
LWARVRTRQKSSTKCYVLIVITYLIGTLRRRGRGSEDGGVGEKVRSVSRERRLAESEGDADTSVAILQKIGRAERTLNLVGTAKRLTVCHEIERKRRTETHDLQTIPLLLDASPCIWPTPLVI